MRPSWYAQLPSRLGHGSWTALYPWASSWGESANAHSTGWNHTQLSVTEWCPELSATGPVPDSTGQVLPLSRSLSIYLQPELKIKSRDRKKVFFIKTKAIYTVLLEHKCRYNILEDMSFHVSLLLHTPKDHLDFSPFTAWQAFGYLGAACTHA